MSNLKTYLAEKYMSGAKAEAILSKAAPLKKKKRKVKETAQPLAGGTMIRDEDGGWGEGPMVEDEDDEFSQAVVEKDRGFKKRKVVDPAAEPSWITVQDGDQKVKEESPAPDEKPMIVDTPAPVMGGLLRPDQLKKFMPQNNVTSADDLTAEEIARAQETVYRDAAGKKIDTKAARANAARLKRLQEEKEAQKMEWGKCLVQKDEAEKRRKELEKSKTTAFARHADDKELNEDLKAKELWNDPAAAFLSVSYTNSMLFDDIQLIYIMPHRKRKQKVLGNLNTQDLHHLRIDLESSQVTDGMEWVSRFIYNNNARPFLIVQ